MANKYTYDNWLNGDVTLVDATRVFDKGDEPKMADWIDFSESDKQKIKEKQSEIFIDKVNTILSEHCSQFMKRFNASEMKNELFNNEIQQCENIMFGQIPNVKVVHLKHWGIGLDHQYLTDIQLYIARTILKGIDDGLSFIHSPNTKYENRNIVDCRIYARFVWEYCKWLKSNSVKEKNHNSKGEINNAIQMQNKTISDEIKQSRIWFKVGLLFANGEMDKLIDKHNKDNTPNFSAIAKELGDFNFRPYISESISGTNNNDKNIFSNLDKINFITAYCENNGIVIVDSFKMRKKKK
jgi:hypothetical protein